MYCPACGEKASEGAKFCKRCGAKLPERIERRYEEDLPRQQVPPQATGQRVAPAPVAGSNQNPVPAQDARRIPRVALIGLATALVVILAVLVFRPFGVGGGKPLLQFGASGGSPNSATKLAVEAFERPSLVQGIQTFSQDDVVAKVASYDVADDLSNVINSNDYRYRIESDSAFADGLRDNGFVVVLDTYSAGKHNGEFWHVYEDNRYAYVPNFVTTDSMMHTYHLYFAHLLKNCERTYLSDELSTLGADMLAVSEEQLETLRGSEWEDAARRNVAFFAVGCALIDPNHEVPAEVSDDVSAELEAIYAASEVAYSTIFPDVQEDYSQYKPRGYYAGDEGLERYFRTMMWYGRMNFTQKDEALDRSALLMTLALNGDRLSSWESIYTVTSFFAGASDDCGYYEYRPLFDDAYGEGATVADLVGNDKAWSRYHAMTAQMPAPKINSVASNDDRKDHLAENKGYRFMGQRFSFDASIFQQLIYNKVGETASHERRMLPDALDIPAAMGSDVALAILEDQGDTVYPGYEENMATLRDDLAAVDDDTWNANLYNQWLHTLQPLLIEKGEGYPDFMRSEAWTRKDLVTYLGSYTELKHDTVLYAKQVMAEMGGGGLDTKDDRGYVEPEPVLFARLAELSRATREGLEGYGMISSEDASNMQLLEELAGKLKTISEKELAGESLTNDEFDLIRTYGGQIEHFWTEVNKDDAPDGRVTSDVFPSALVTDVATDPNGSCLELGTGNPATIYVIVEVEGSLRIASGSVFSFYQFEQPLSERLTDTTWRQIQGFSAGDNGMVAEPAHDIVPWAQDFSIDPRK